MMADPTPDSTPDSTGCGRREPYALQVLGDAMEPEFPAGCVVIIEPAEACRSGAYVVAEVDGVRWFRRYLKDAQGGDRLLAENRGYPDIALAGRDWALLGVITQRNIRRVIKHYD